MDVLKNKKYKDYDTLSRFVQFPTYYHTKDKKYVYGILSQLDTDKKYVEHSVEERDTLESIAYKYYGRPDYYWVVAMFNNINDCFVKLFGKYKTVKVPVISNITFK